MKQPVFLEYTFLFDSSETWSHLSQFEADLADFFSVHEYQAEIVKTVGGQSGKRIMMLTRIDMPRGQVQTVQDERRKQPGSQIKEMAQRKLPKPAIQFMKGNK
jgi:hypothetical protein